jgi:hypothetical protein
MFLDGKTALFHREEVTWAAWPRRIGLRRERRQHAGHLGFFQTDIFVLSGNASRSMLSIYLHRLPGRLLGIQLNRTMGKWRVLLIRDPTNCPFWAGASFYNRDEKGVTP